MPITISINIICIQYATNPGVDGRCRVFSCSNGCTQLTTVSSYYNYDGQSPPVCPVQVNFSPNIQATIITAESTQDSPGPFTAFCPAGTWMIGASMATPITAYNLQNLYTNMMLSMQQKSLTIYNQ